ncbi:Gfo/Idh/MocA family protein [Effusibacillus pohliae]|uniref:Gfo/Idh/MocA family protein n=1 Tax=Effusibacillus pohliae TaxID=232270 RepID=UPI00038078F5|nr:Gfo/Idh/MocA family oxidoreductase [Effusibacillus pohliae]
MADTLRIGLIGAGGIARQRHLPGCAALPETEIVAVFDAVEATARQAASDFHIPVVHTDYRQMLEQNDIDAVIITTPNAYHAPIAIDAMQAGKHVLCEKPMAASLQEAKAMVRVQRETGCTLMIALNNRFRSDSQWIKQLVYEGELGDIYHAKTGWLRRAGIPGWGGWFTSKRLSGGGPLIDLGVHMLDLALWLMGSPEPVAVSGVTYRKFGDRPDHQVRTWNVANPQGVFDVEDLASAFIRCADGSTLTLDVSWAANIEKERRFLHLLGVTGGVQLENDAVMYYGERGGQLVDVAPQFPQVPGAGPHSVLEKDGSLAMLREFARAVRTGTPPLCSAEEGLRVARILDALYRSAEAGREIRLDG